MEIGETVAVVVDMMSKAKCVICSSDHPDPKKDKINKVAPGNSGWHRKSMAGVFQSDGIRETIYFGNTFPPTYKYQGHHCVALSAFVEDANSKSKSPNDRRLRLNFYLDQVGFFPNRPENSIGLPARKGHGHFDEFFKSLDANRPLQLHGPGHDESYFGKCDRLLSSLVEVIADPEGCEEKTKDEWKDQLKKLITQAENYAFKKMAANDGGWRLHPAEQIAALRLYFLPTNKTMSVTGKGGVKEVRKGLGRAEKDIIFPNLKLDCGPFA